MDTPTGLEVTADAIRSRLVEPRSAAEADALSVEGAQALAKLTREERAKLLDLLRSENPPLLATAPAS